MDSFITGRRAALRIFLSAAIFFLLTLGAFGQTTCTFNASSPTVHQEGLAEPVGNISFTCTGGTAGSTVSLTVFVTLNTNITNRLDANGNPLGITVTGAASSSVRMNSATSISLNPVNYTVPAAPATPVTITVGGIVAAVASLSNGSAGALVTASILGIGASFPSNFSTTVAMGTPTLQQSAINNGVPCQGSALPASTDFNSFIAAMTSSSTVRITEASPAAFSAKAAGADTGVRIMVNLTGYGAGASLYAPDAIVGNSGTLPTSTGAFASTIAPGTYTPGANQLLLIRVSGADSTGAGGSLAIPQPNTAATVTSMTQLTVTAGSATAVYEVVDGNPNLVESAQIPVFVVVAQTSCPGTLTPSQTAVLAPVSTVSIATATDPIPRFVTTAVVSDCTAHGDCGSFYFPHLYVNTTPLSLTGSSLGAPQSATVPIANTGSGTLNFTTSIAYQSGSGWLSVLPSSGSVPSGNLMLIANPGMLQPGTYTATLTVSAGSYGTGVVPVTFTVGPVGVVIQNVGNAASYQYGTVAPGSYAVVFGLNMQNATVTFNGLNATIIYSALDGSQINLIVPAALGAQQGAAVVATVNGLASNSFTVKLIPNSPGVFNPGIVNFDDGSVNGAAHPATRGHFVSVYLTGLAIPVTGQVTVNIGSQTNLIPSSAGAQGTFPALDQVNITVPATLPATPNPVPLQVCIPGSTGQQVCSTAVNLYIQ